MDENFRRAIYSAGIEWGKAHLSDFAYFHGTYNDFKKVMHKIMERDGFPEETFSPVRIYNQYLRHADEVEGYFVAGVWDVLNGNTFEDIIVT
jgi:hypothetical protein